MVEEVPGGYRAERGTWTLQSRLRWEVESRRNLKSSPLGRMKEAGESEVEAGEGE